MISSLDLVESERFELPDHLHDQWFQDYLIKPL